MAKSVRIVVISLSCILTASALAAGNVRFLKRSERFCDVSGELCIHGSLTYRPNSRELRVLGRVVIAPGPGLLKISMSGSNRQDHRYRSEMKIAIRGRYSEIIDHKMIPDPPDVDDWEVASITFDLDDEN